MKIVVVFGGFSTERAISFQSAKAVYNELSKKYDVIAIDLAYPDDEIVDFEYREAEKSNYNIISSFLKRLNSINPDKIFIGLHGSEGENGQIQSLFELTGFNYYSCDSISSSLSMDKFRSKIVVSKFGIKTAKSDFITKENFSLDYLKLITKDYSFPFVVKANSQGSSVGVFIVKSNNELESAYNSLIVLDDDFLVEEYISGREFSIPILKGKALTPVEIEPIEGFYDYENKYQEGKTNHYCPARLNKIETEKIKSDGEKVFSSLGCSHYARADFILDENGNFNFLEINTLPGMTKLSLMPESALSLGISFMELLERIMDIGDSEL
ncbi:MAG: hypothetical protein CR982_02910 [Candidatus Cloacimonadota bacterium]|nr:MAG: hypothetical protein CR982_02910 [Candidatus Cloacimonadota bacterium]PIE79219.1 MAG: hypothetical protein CSA15_04105 [Candidatus Delongbacteria bacterium]